MNHDPDQNRFRGYDQQINPLPGSRLAGGFTEPTSPAQEKCQGCSKNLGTPELHTCPFQSEINDDSSEVCNCCINCE